MGWGLKWQQCKGLVTLFSSVQLSRSVVSNSLWPHEWQHARPPCSSSTPGVHSNSCPSSHWCHSAISSSVAPPPFAFNHSQHQGLFQWDGSSHQVAKVLELQLSISPSNEYSVLISFEIDWFDLLAVQGTLRVFSSTTIQKHQFFGTHPSLWSNSHTWNDYCKNHSFNYIDLFLASWCLYFLTCCLGLL